MEKGVFGDCWEKGETGVCGVEGGDGSGGMGGRPWVDCSINGGGDLAFSSIIRARWTASEYEYGRRTW